MALRLIEQDTAALTRKLSLSLELSLLEKAWNMEIGAMGGAVRLAAIERAVLVVEVLSSAAMQEVLLRKRELVRRINRHFPKPFIEHINVRMAHGS